MKIVHVVEPFATGINTFIHELVFGLQDCEHTIVHGEREENRSLAEIKQEYNGKATFIDWKSAKREINPIQDFKAYRDLKHILDNLEFDVLHLHSSKAGILGRLYASSRGFKKVIYTPNGASFLRTDVSNKQKFVFKTIERFFSYLSGKVISSSESEDIAFKQIGIKSIMIKNGVQVPEFNRKMKTPGTPLKIVTCGKITTQKGPYFFNQIADFFQKNKQFEFVWIGDGEDRDELVSENITVLGWQGKDQVFKHLQEADVYLSTSFWEGLPLAGIEAMGSSLPLILHDCPGNRDLVKSGENGFLFDSFSEAILYLKELADTPEKLHSLSLSSKAIYQQEFVDYRCARDYRRVYNSLNPNSDNTFRKTKSLSYHA